MRQWLSRPVDAASLGLFRLLFGLCLTWSFVKYVLNDTLTRQLTGPTFHFHYPGLEWVPDPPAQLLVGVVIGSSLLLALGLLTRLASLLFLLSHSWWFLAEASYYNNHYYLISLLGLLFLVTNPERFASLDARRLKLCGQIPAWQLYLFRFQILVVYFYGGLAKLNPDWLQGIPVRYWLADRAGLWHLPMLAWPLTSLVVTWGGITIDLVVPWLVLWRPTRWPAVAVLLSFHLANAFLFTIGVFPWLMMAACLLLLPPDLLRRAPARPSSDPPLRPAAAFMLALYVALQLLLPLRHLLRPGEVVWNEDGHLFSWRMKLREKVGVIGFAVTDGERLEIPNLLDDLTPYQVQRMQGRPWLTVQYARMLAERARSRGMKNPQVQAWTWVSLNRRPCQNLLDPRSNLAEGTVYFPYLELTFPPPGPARLELALQQPTGPSPVFSYQVDVLDAENHPVGTARAGRYSTRTAQSFKLTGLPEGPHAVLVLAVGPGGQVLGHLLADLRLQPGPNRYRADLSSFVPGPPFGLISGLKTEPVAPSPEPPR